MSHSELKPEMTLADIAMRMIELQTENAQLTKLIRKEQRTIELLREEIDLKNKSIAALREIRKEEQKGTTMIKGCSKCQEKIDFDAFRNLVNQAKWVTSGLCQKCQDKEVDEAVQKANNQ